MGFSVEAGNLERDFKILFRRAPDDASEVEYLFDHRGSETFDPTVAVEAIVGGRSVRLQAGDNITFVYE